jgi:hypothetical protein
VLCSELVGWQKAVNMVGLAMIMGTDRQAARRHDVDDRADEGSRRLRVSRGA